MPEKELWTLKRKNCRVVQGWNRTVYTHAHVYVHTEAHIHVLPSWAHCKGSRDTSNSGAWFLNTVSHQDDPALSARWEPADPWAQAGKGRDNPGIPCVRESSENKDMSKGLRSQIWDNVSMKINTNRKVLPSPNQKSAGAS